MESMDKKKIPIGVDDYREMTDQNLYYVDKTLMLRDIIDDGSKVLLYTRPRRFGKTLNMSMIYYYFNKSDKDMSYLFTDKKIWKSGEKYRAEQGKYPVIYMTFKDWKPLDWDHGYKRIVSDIATLFNQFSYLLKSKIIEESEITDFKNICNKIANRDEYESSLKFLSHLLQKHNKQNVIILIDEYDTLLNEAYSKGFYNDAVAFLRNFLGSALKNNLALHKAALTGIFKVAKESIFSDLNNFSMYSIMDNDYNNCFGFTQDEVAEMLSYFEVDEKIENVGKWYNGYNFGETILATVYNPWSLLKFMKDKTLKPYWINTSGNKIIKDLILAGDKDLHHKIEDLMNGKTLFNMQINQFLVYEDINKSQDNLWSFLLMSGYLKFTNLKLIGTDAPTCDLQMPNMEVLSLYRIIYKNWIAETMPRTSVSTLLNALLSKNMKEFYTIFQDIVLRTLSYNDTNKTDAESFYHAFTLGILVNLDDRYIVKSNRESGFGRYDVMIIPKDTSKTGIIIEFKTTDSFEKETLEAALKAAMKQIDEKKYDVELQSMGVSDILKLAIAFHGKEVIMEWK